MKEDNIIRNETKEIYFIILYPREKIKKGKNEKNERNEEFIFDKIENPPISIYTKFKDEKEKIFYIKVYKYLIKKEKKVSNINLDFSIDNNKYSIDFDVKESSFIYDINLREDRAFYKTKKDIPQNTIDYYEKMNYFMESLKESKEDDKSDILFADSIILYSKNPRFDFLINIFLNVYENKDLCSKLLNEFNKNCEKSEQKNNIVKDYLIQFKETFKDICENSDNLILENSYNPVDFYGLVLCYLNNYENEKFLEIFEKLFEKKKEILFNIMMKYKSYFKNEIRLNDNHLKDFINFAADKEYKEFIEKALFYLKGINMFLRIIEYNKEKIILIKEFKPIEIIKFDEPNFDIKEIILLTEKIIKFSKEKNKLLVYFTNQFWDSLLNHCSSHDKENIEICYEVREKFQSYYDLVILIYEKKNKSTIKNNAQIYFEKDEYAFLLNKNIKYFINEEKNIENIEIISLIFSYNVYYKNEKYLIKREVEILDKIDFERIDDEFIQEFKKKNFEKIFIKKIDKYLLLLVNKVKKIEDFENILQLINENELNKKKNTYLNLLIERYDIIIKEINLLLSSCGTEQLEKIAQVLAKLANFLYINQNNDLVFLKQKINKLENNLKYKIYI